LNSTYYAGQGRGRGKGTGNGKPLVRPLVFPKLKAKQTVALGAGGVDQFWLGDVTKFTDDAVYLLWRTRDPKDSNVFPITSTEAVKQLRNSLLCAVHVTSDRVSDAEIDKVLKAKQQHFK
jgi:hypothetical protein